MVNVKGTSLCSRICDDQTTDGRTDVRFEIFFQILTQSKGNYRRTDVTFKIFIIYISSDLKIESMGVYFQQYRINMEKMVNRFFFFSFHRQKKMNSGYCAKKGQIANDFYFEMAIQVVRVYICKYLGKQSVQWFQHYAAVACSKCDGAASGSIKLKKLECANM